MPYTVEKINPKKSVLIVVDMQNDFINEGAPLDMPAGRAIIPTVQAVIDHCRSLEIPVIFTTHMHRPDGLDMGRFADVFSSIAERKALIAGTPGAEVIAELAPQDSDILLPKHRFSAFFNTDLEVLLSGMGVDTVILVGVTTDACVNATARDAMFRDYKVVIVGDATASYGYPDLGQGAISAEDVQSSSLKILRFTTADVVDAEEFVRRSTE